jgi:hypothetical protein
MAKVATVIVGSGPLDAQKLYQVCLFCLFWSVLLSVIAPVSLLSCRVN